MAVKIVCVVLLLELLCTTSMVICQVHGDSDYSNEADIRIKFLLEPNDLIVRKGKSAVLHCVARSVIQTETVGISWTFNDEHLDLEQDSRRYMHRNGSLIFTKVISKKQNGPSDEGTYRCVARSENVALASKPAQLKVAYFSKNISIYPTDEDSVVVGQTVRIACNLDSMPPAEISWSFQNRTLSSLESNSRYNMIIPGILYISDVQVIDSGEYRCIGKNKVIGKTRVSGPCKLIVTSKNDSASTSLRKLEFLSPLLPKVVTVRQNHDLILDCAVRGFTNMVNLFWIYSRSESEDKIILKNNTRGFSTYKKSNVKITDSGIYTCIASLATVSKGNPIVSNQEIRVNVITPPIIVKGPKNWNLPIALNVRFECEAIGNPIPSISWLHNGIPLKADSKGRIKQSENELILKNTVSDDSGIYQCVATNDFGSVYAASQLSITGSSYQPSPPVNVHCITLNSTQILVSWQLPPDDSFEQPPILIKAQDPDTGDTYDGYRDHVSIQKVYSVHYYLTDDDPEVELQELSVNRSIVLNRLQPHKNYTIYIRTYNGKSGSDLSQHVTCQTNDPEQTIQITMKVVGPTMVFLRWLIQSKNNVEEDNLTYRVQWRKSFSAEFNIYEMETNTTSFTLFGLHPSTEYELRVIAVSKTGNIRAESEWLSVMTHPDSSIFVPVLKLDILNSTSVQVTWKIDEKFEIDTLKLSYRKEHENNDKAATFVNLNADQRKYVISALEPGSSYNISLEVTVDMATNGIASEVIQMPPEFNDELRSSLYLPAPTNVQAESRSPNTIHVTWTPPKDVSVNFYTIYCVSLEDTTSNDNSRIVTSFNNTALITDLYSNVLYEVKVVACRNDTYSEFSEKVQVRTSNYVSGIIDSISWVVLNSSSVRVSWQHSLNPSSISSFIVRYTKQRNAPFQMWKSLFIDNATTIDIANLNENTNYYVMVQAKLSSGNYSSPNITSIFIGSHRSLQSSTASLATSKYNITDEQWLGIYIGIAIGLCCIVLCIGFVYVCRKRYNKQKEEFEEQRKRRFSPNNHEISKMSSCYNKIPYAVNGYVNNNATVQIPLLPSSSEGTSNGIAPNVHLTETSRHFELSKGVSLQEETNTLLSSDSIAEDDSPTTLNAAVPDKDDKEAGDSGYCDRRSSQSPQLNDSSKSKSRKSSEITIDDGFYENDMHTMVQVHG